MDTWNLIRTCFFDAMGTQPVRGISLFLLELGAAVVLFWIFAPVLPSGAALTTVLFLGGWRGPFDESLGGLPGVVWTLLKTMALAFVVIWARVSYPRLREDQLQRLAWQGLVPVALGQLVLTGVVAVMVS